MANRTLNITETINHGVVMLVGSFLPQAALAPLPNPIWAGSPALGQWGQGIASIVWTATGVWTATLTDSWYRMLAGNAAVRMADGANVANANMANIQNPNVTGATVNSIPPRTLTITNTLSNTGALANVAAGTNQMIYFYLWVQKTSVQ